MRIITLLSAITPFLFLTPSLQAQVDQEQTGAWYMYMWSHENPDTGFGLQGDIQERLWDVTGDLEQLLIRGGVTWRPENSPVKYTAGYAHITSGAFGPGGGKFRENRLYQEALAGQKVGERLYVTHRFRLEQRWVDNQDFRSRLRYSIGLNLPFNQATLDQGAIYLALYNELFINLERDIGAGRRVDYFDRNRAYAALGYSPRDNMRLQFGYMWQENNNYGKGQLQFNFIHSF